MVLCSLTAGYLLTMIFLFIRDRLLGKLIGKRNAEMAISKGNIVCGIPLKYPDRQTNMPGILGYSVSGNHYEHETFDMDRETDSVQLYYLAEPEFARTFSELGKYQWSHKQLFVFISLCCCFLWMIIMQ